MEAADLTPAQITESWRTFGCDYASCQQTINHRCRTASGALAAVHANRRVKMAAYLSRQPEVDALNALVTSLRGANDQLTAALDLETDKVDVAAEQIATLKVQAETQAANYRSQAADLAAARARIAELEADVPPTPVPTGNRFLVGGCPPSPGGTKTADGQRVIDLLGKGAADRQFLSGVSTVAPRPRDASRVTVSYSFGSDESQRPTAQQWGTATKPLIDGVDLVAWYHEFDAKVRAGTYTLAGVSAAADWNLARLAEVRPNLETVAILTGWLFSPNKTAPTEAARDAYGPIAARHSYPGIDLDGIHTWPYVDYTKHIPNILRWMDKFGMEKFVVSEMGWSKLGTKSGSTFTPHTHDQDGAIRAAKYAELLDALKATGRCIGVDLFLYDTTPGYNLTSPPELAALKALVASNPKES